MVRHEALISEKVFSVDNGRFVLERCWNLHHPRCPMVLSPYHSQIGPKDVYVEQKVLSAEQYRELFGTKGHESLK